jgi:hypothetical protein
MFAPSLVRQERNFGCGDRATEIAARDNICPQSVSGDVFKVLKFDLEPVAGPASAITC